MTEILQTGSTLGRYRLMQRIGIGGMAEVFLGVQAGAAGFQRQVAIKVLLPGDESEQLIESLVTEAQLAAQLGHPNIVQVIDFGVHGKGFFLVMEYLNGWPLDNVIRTARKQKATIPLDVLADVGLQVLDALAFAHDATDGDGTHLEVIHRDIKPANMMVLPMGLLKLVDFGIAKAATIERRTVTGMAKGTPSYMAPEQLRGHDVGPGADIYALSVSLFEMAVGKPLFTGDSFMDLMARRLRPVGPDDLKLLDAIYPELTPIIGRGLATDPADRWPDANSMATALRALVPITPRLPLKTWLKELKIEEHRPLTQSGIRIGGGTESDAEDSTQAPAHGTESIEHRVTQPAPGDGVLGAEASEEPDAPPTRAHAVAPEVPPTRAQYIEPEVPPTRAQYVDVEATGAQATAGEEDHSGTVFQARLPTGPALSAAEPTPSAMAPTGSGQGLSTTKFVLFLGLFCLVSALLFSALGSWLWIAWTNKGGDSPVPVTAEPVEPDPTEAEPTAKAEHAAKAAPADKAKPTAKAKPKPTAKAKPSAKVKPTADSRPATDSQAAKTLRNKPTIAERQSSGEAVRRTRTTEREAKVAAEEPRMRAAKVERKPRPPTEVSNPFAGMIGPGESNLKFPSLEGFPGMVGSLKVQVTGGSDWTFGVSGRGTARSGRALSKLPPGPVKVEIFDASGRKRGGGTVVIVPGEASECTWRVDIGFVGGGSCTKI